MAAMSPASGQGRRQPRGQGMGGQDRLDPRHVGRGEMSELLRQPRRGGETDGHRLAVQIAPVASHLFDGMAESVPEIQQRTAALRRQFAFIRLDNARLDRTAAADDRRQFGAGGRQGANAPAGSNSAASPSRPYLITSAMPAANSRGGSVASSPVAMKTPRGW